MPIWPVKYQERLYSEFAQIEIDTHYAVGSRNADTSNGRLNQQIVSVCVYVYE